MPLKPGSSQEIISENIATLISEGKTQDEAIAIAYEFAGLAKPDKTTKKFKGSLVAIKSTSGARYAEGYLVRYDSLNDLQGERFSKSTNFLREGGFPIKGSPIMYEHGLTDFGAIGIGVFDFVDEDDIGLFVRGKLYEREDYERMLEEISKRKSLSLSQDIIFRKAELAVKAVDSALANVKHQWSMGAYVPTVEISPDGHIDQCGIVEGSLTVIPAEPNGTEANIYQKSLFEAFTISSPVVAEKSSLTGNTPNNNAINKQLNNENPGVKQMDMQVLRDAVAALLAMIDQGAMEEEMDSKQISETELEDETMKAAEELLNEDEKTKQAMEEKEKEEGAKSANKLLATWLEDNAGEIFGRALSNVEQKRNKINAAFKSALPDDQPRSKRSQAGAYGTHDNPGKAPAQIGKAQKPGLYQFVKSALNNDFRDFYGKAQNPYIGEQGGYLLGQELSNEILPPLRENVVAFDAGVRQRTASQRSGTYTVAKMTTAPSAYRPGINTAIGDSDAKFETITAFLRPIAAECHIPFQLLSQSPLAVEQSIREQMIESISLQIDLEILNGVGTVTGSNTGAEIRGVKTVLEGDSTLRTTNIKTLATNGAKPTFADASAAETQIANGNVPDTKPKSWIMNARSRGRFRDLTTTTGEPLFRENFGNEPFARLLGYPIHVSNQISNTLTTGTSSDTSEIYFGAWDYIEYIMGDSLEVIVDRVTLANQLMARIIAFTYSDLIIHYPQAFYVMKGVR